MLMHHSTELSLQPPARWLVARTRPRAEKQVISFCDHCQWPCYLPTRRSLRRYAKRTVAFAVPLFSGYAFAQVTEEQQRRLGEFRHVVHLIVPDLQQETQLVRELNSLLVLERAMLAGELQVRPEIKVGQPVTIRGGPLTGLQGIVTRRRQVARLTINVEMLGQSVTLDMDVGEVEPYI